MYYLIKDCNNLRIVGSCEDSVYKEIIYFNWCVENNVIHVSKASDLESHCKTTGTYSYKVNRYRYVVVYCENIKETLIFPKFFRKSILFHLEFLYYKHHDFSCDCHKLTDVDLKIK